MSYDVTIDVHWFNYTYNLSGFFRDHVSGPDGRVGIQALDGLTGRQAATILHNSFEKLNDTRSRLGDGAMSQKYDAPNGWGSVLGAVLFLARLHGACAAKPRHKVRVS